MDGLKAALRRQVERAPVARLATVRTDGRPHLVPITFALEGDHIVTVVDHKPKTSNDLRRLRNLEANPAASVLVDHYDDDWDRLWWARADGKARVVHEGPDWARAVDRLVEKYRPYGDHRPAGPVIAMTVDHWTSWSAAP